MQGRTQLRMRSRCHPWCRSIAWPACFRRLRSAGAACPCHVPPPPQLPRFELAPKSRPVTFTPSALPWLMVMNVGWPGAVRLCIHLMRLRPLPRQAGQAHACVSPCWGVSLRLLLQALPLQAVWHGLWGLKASLALFPKLQATCY